MIDKKNWCSRLLATWPEFWAIGLSFLDTFAFSLDTLLAHSGGGVPPLSAKGFLAKLLSVKGVGYPLNGQNPLKRFWQLPLFKEVFSFGMEVMESLLNHEGWWAGDWDGLKLESFPNCFLWIGMHSKIYGVCPKLIPKRGVVQFFRFFLPGSSGHQKYSTWRASWAF